MKTYLTCIIVAVCLAGCSACHKNPCCGPTTGPPPPRPPVTNAYLLPAHPLTPCDSCPAPNVARLPPNSLPPTAPPYRRLPDDSSVRLAIPEASPAESARQGVRLFPPQVSDTGVQPVVAEERGGTPQLPAIYQFAVVKDKIASGLKPAQEGVDWLNAKGFRTVLYLRPPGKDDLADRKLIEGTGGLKYLPLEVSPETLSKDVVEQFTKIVDDAANRPLFVYDNDGTLAGGLWYLYFRLVDNLPDDKARQEAGRLGLREGGTTEQVTMWIAVQKYLRDQGKQ